MLWVYLTGKWRGPFWTPGREWAEQHSSLLQQSFHWVAQSHQNGAGTLGQPAPQLHIVLLRLYDLQLWGFLSTSTWRKWGSLACLWVLANSWRHTLVENYLPCGPTEAQGVEQVERQGKQASAKMEGMHGFLVHILSRKISFHVAVGCMREELLVMEGGDGRIWASCIGGDTHSSRGATLSFWEEENNKKTNMQGFQEIDIYNVLLGCSWSWRAVSNCWKKLALLLLVDFSSSSCIGARWLRT